MTVAEKQAENIVTPTPEEAATAASTTTDDVVDTQDDVEGAEDGDDEESRLWREVQEDRRLEKEGKPPVERETPDQSPAAAAPATDAPKTTEKPAAQPKGKPTDPFDLLKPEERPQFDALAKLATTPEAKANLNKIVHELVSNRSRVSALTKKTAGLPNARVAPPTVREAKPVAETLKSIPAWSKFKEEYKEVAEALEIGLGAVADPVQQDLKAMSEAELEAHYVQQEELVLKAHPDFDAIVASKEWKSWVNSQQPYVRDAIMRNAKALQSGPEVIDFLDRYKADQGIVPPPPAPPAPSKPKTAARRMAQEESSVAPIGGRQARAVTDEPPKDGASEDDYWEWAKRVRSKERAVG